jgi:hypothetical protein
MARTVLAAVAAGLALLNGTPHPERIDVADGRRESVRCGAGRDVVVADPLDTVARSCETVSVRIGVDRTTGTGQHPSVVEPSAASSGTGVVAVFQLGRYRDGAAEANGFATSADGGRTWRSGILPGLTISGPWARASDPVVAWDALHGVWLASSLVVTQDTSGLAVNRSTDGVSWAPPVAAVPNAGGISYDKEWVTCDDWPASPRRGSCYLLWTDVRAHGLDASVSHDGGLTWSPAVVAARSGAIAEPTTLPDGTLVVAYLAGGELTGPIVAVRSTDGGTTFSDPVTVADLQFASGRGLRMPPLPSIAVDGGGRIVVAWPDCRFRAGCAANDPVFSASTDGLAWSPPARAASLPRTASALLATAGAGTSGRLAVCYYVATGGALGFRLVTSADGGATWTPPRILDATPMQRSWLPVTEGGRFLGDYVALPFVAGRPFPVYALATSARTEAVFAATVLR